MVVVNSINVLRYAQAIDVQAKLISAPDIGKVLACTLFGELPSFGKPNQEEITVFVDVAPMNGESSSYNGKRHIRGGNHRLHAQAHYRVKHTPETRGALVCKNA